MAPRNSLEEILEPKEVFGLYWYGRNPARPCTPAQPTNRARSLPAPAHAPHVPRIPLRISRHTFCIDRTVRHSGRYEKKNAFFLLPGPREKKLPCLVMLNAVDITCAVSARCMRSRCCARLCHHCCSTPVRRRTHRNGSVRSVDRCRGVHLVNLLLSL